MQANLETLERLERRLSVAVPIAEIDSEIESVVMEDNVVAWALSAARTEDKTIEFDELMGGAKQ